jgi:hypothetical protein
MSVGMVSVNGPVSPLSVALSERFEACAGRTRCGLDCPNDDSHEACCLAMGGESLAGLLTWHAGTH